jgi:hypothetical protein
LEQFLDFPLLVALVHVQLRVGVMGDIQHLVVVALGLPGVVLVLPEQIG